MSTPPPAPPPPEDPPRREWLGRAARWATLAAAWTTMGVGCGGGGSEAAPSPPPPPGAPRLTTLNSSLSGPWSLAFLPDGRMLVTEKSGRLRRVSADGRTIEAEISGVPTVVADGQGGLLDVVLGPDFAATPWVYLTYSERGSGPDLGRSGTAVARGRLVGNTLQGVEVIYRQVPKTTGSGHFGSRMVFAADGTLFVALGERQLGNPAQDLVTSLGKIVRIRPDGSIPPDNPALGVGARPEIWSYGHRNPQALALHPTTGELWSTEHGPQGGDELNRVQRGGNHGWPLVSYGCPYGSPVGNGCRIGGGTHAPNYVEPVSYWVPVSTAPSSLLFYTGAGFPEWQGSAFIGALAGETLWRVVLNGNSEVSREEPLSGMLDTRVRCVRQGPDGWIYLLTDSGQLLRIER
ncbi:MAG TPA: PQQ-dependent sugar dehydrogenase [Ideonella sp.]|uniref:PQQ-dependent sugar dehydrogenase n=1 Tax=Ideonella sp. TaxID=1929293 RepID=UPI002E34F7FB|nr:PQQ-dependent sugar dehydrogenase [Ideonella sp.]HEX5687166.1 PQQ-dependent sugar dehydrogenase [Ideonella sp.]